MLNVLTSTEILTKDQWKEYRNQGIGGSDVAAICGLNKYKSQFQLSVPSCLFNLHTKITTVCSHRSIYTTNHNYNCQ
jgi:hypothetical protein